MAEPPVSFKRTKSKPTQRARQLVDTSDASEGVESREDSPSALATKIKNKQKARLKPKAKLSFGDDEEEGDGEVFRVKKSSLSRKLTLGKSGKVSPSSFDPTATPRSEGPTYSAAYLSELKANTPTSRPPLPDDHSYDADMSVDTDLFSPLNVIDLSDEVEMETVIPADSSILAAKQKRERMRKTGATGEEDFISLSLTKRNDFTDGPHPESRLVREEDELGEADDEFAEYTAAQERVALGKKSRKLEAKKRREQMNEMIADADEEDEETKEWEQEQLRRGGHREEERASQTQKLTYQPTPIPPVTQIPTLNATVDRLTQSLSKLVASHSQNTAAMASLGQEQLQLDSREKELRDMITRAETKRSWFSAFREWVESVATFLDEKYPSLEALENEHVSIVKERYDMISQRRRAEDEDDLSLVLGEPPQTSQPEDFDELGRLVPHVNPAVVRRQRVIARNARRANHRQRIQEQDQEEGLSTDSELTPSDATDYQTAMQSLSDEVQDVLDDVRAEEFRDPTLGLAKWFGEWRERFGDSYAGAWGGLGMVSAWEFWARLEIVGWNPFDDPRTLDSFAWYNAIYQFAHQPEHEHEDDGGDEPDGPDKDLLSSMISTAIVPRLSQLIEAGGFDPYSARDLRRLTDLAEQIEVSVDKDGLKFQILLKSVFTIFQAAVASTETIVTPYLALNQPRFNPEAIPARLRFLNRRLKLLRNIMAWRKYSNERFGIGALATSLVSNCMLPVAEGGWEVGGEQNTLKVAALLSKELQPLALKTRLGIV